MSRLAELNNARDAVSVSGKRSRAMKWLIRSKETGLYLKNVWNWTNQASEAFVFPTGVSLVQFCIQHQIPPMEMIPLTKKRSR